MVLFVYLNFILKSLNCLAFLFFFKLYFEKCELSHSPVLRQVVVVGFLKNRGPDQIFGISKK